MLKFGMVIDIFKKISILTNKNLIFQELIMKFKIPVLVFTFALVNLNILHAQSIQTSGRITNSVYAFEGLSNDGNSSVVHTRLYQFLRFKASAKDLNNLTLNISARALTDLETDLTDEQRFAAYRLSLSATDLFNNILDFEIGRQFLHAGIPFGSLDGAAINLKPVKNFSWKLYGGVESHLFRSFKLYETDDALVYGTALTYQKFYNSNIQLAYLQKSNSSETQWQILGLNISNYSLNYLTFLLQAHYDLVNSRLHRFVFSANYIPVNDWNISFRLKQQFPQIYGYSFFQIFDIKQYQKAGMSGGYVISKNFSLSAGYNFVRLKDGNGHQIITSLDHTNGSIAFVYETGDLGQQTGFLLDYGYELLTDLDATISIDYSRYRFEEIYDYENQLANALRLSYKFSRNFRTDIEYQWLNNRIADSDQRILNHIHFIW